MIILVAPMAGISVGAATNEDGFIEIRTVEDLYAVRNDLTANYILMNDIDLTEATAEGGDYDYYGNGWNPIGSNNVYSNGEFSGEFDGNGHSIIGMRIDVTATPSGTSSDIYLGLFANVSGSVHNLSFVDCNISSSLYGRTYYAGSVSGFIIRGIVSNVATSTDFDVRTSNSYKVYIGGITGYQNGGTIEKCYNTGTIAGGNYLSSSGTSSSVYGGGIAGYVSYCNGYGSGVIKNCYNTTKIKVRCYSSSTTTDTFETKYTKVGGIVGYIGDSCKITTCYNVGMAGNTTYDWAIGDSVVTNCFYLDGAGKSTSGATMLTEAQMKLQSMYAGFDFENTWIIDPLTSYKYPQLRSNRQDTDKVVEVIEIVTEPTKIAYYTGDKLDVTGGVITVYYVDGSSENMAITSDMVSQEPLTELGINEATVTFRGASCSYYINVTEKPNILTLTLISEPDNTVFVKNTSLDFTGCTAIATYDNNTSEAFEITPEMTTGADISTVGVQTVKFTHDGLEVEFQIEVIPIKIASIEIISLPTKLIYIEGQDLETDGLKVIANYNNGTTKEVTDYSVSGYSSEVGVHTVVVSHSNKTDTFEVTVKEKGVAYLTVETAPTKTVYIQGEKFDPAGMVVTATYDNGFTKEITNYTVGSLTDAVGNQAVSVTFEGVTTYATVNVIEKILKSIVITSLPNKTNYIEDEDFDTTGMIVTGKYNDGSEAEITNYTLTGAATTTKGTKIVTVSCGGVTNVFTIKVVAKTLQDIKVDMPEKTDYIVGESFDSTGMVVKAYYDNGKNYEVTNYTVTGFTGDVGTNTVTVTYQGKTYSFAVTVHSPDEWEITIEPTCTEKGERKLYCIECSELLKTEEIAPLGHTEVVDEGYEATCLDNGLTSGKHCSVCSEVLTEQQIIPATGHTAESLWTVINNSTCTIEGYKVKYCKDCHEVVESSDIDLAEHTPVIDEGKAVTCLTSGLTDGSHCSVCNAVLVAQEVIEPIGHQWDSGHITKTVNCTTAGEITYHCTNCTATKTEVVSALNHNFDKEFTIDKQATCTESGSKSKHCSRCNEVTDVTVIEKLGHNFSDYVSDNNHTCLVDGTKTAECKRCGLTDTITADGSAIGHIASGWTITEQPDCTHSGLKIKVCTVCGATLETAVVDAMGHTVVVDKAVSATCENTGLTEGSHCSICKLVLVPQNTVAKLGHDYSESFTVDKEATCTEQGIKSKHCTRCDSKIDGTPTEAKGHSYGKWITDEESTCTVTGQKHKVCDNCGDVVSEYTALLDHIASDWFIDEEPTCTTAGKKHKECAVCEVTIETAEINKSSHSETVEWTVIKEPTCTNKGIKEKYCDECGTVVLTEEIPAIGHTQVTDSAVAPTCTQTGLTVGSHCSVCNAVLTAQTAVGATGHAIVVDKAVEATCTATGLTQGKHCSVCNVVLVAQTVIDATGHTKVIDNAVAPTCTQSGLTAGSHCFVCDDVLVAQKFIEATGHTHTSEVTTPATCTEEGITTYTCHCGDSYTEVIPMTVHNTTTDSKPATYFEDGYENKEVCQDCGAVISEGTVIKKLVLKTPAVRVTGGKKKITVKYTKVTGATGFEVKYKVGKKNVTKVFNTKKSATKTIKKLAKGTYKVQVRAFVKQGNKTAYSSWTKAKSVKVK